MSKLEQAARQALDMMEFVVKYPRAVTNDAALRETIAALREALAEQSYDKAHGISSYHLQETEQAEQEPVAWVINHLNGTDLDWDLDGWKPIGKPQPLYAAPVSIAKQSETDSSSSLMRTTVRTKDLTDDEIEAAVLSVNTTMEAWITYRAVIAADREKNK